jgi:uncharacterized small protein (DUF1192 family)
MGNKEELLHENEILKEGYVKLMNDRDVMLEWGKPQLEALYATKIGTLQLEKLKLQLSVKGLKRKIELTHQFINKNEQPDFIFIELQIAGELANAEANIIQQTNEIFKAKILLTHLESPERSAELRKIFRTVAKQLHPDINFNLTEEQLQIWYRMKDAYHTGDLERLKALQVVYENQINEKRNANETGEEEIILQNTTLKEGITLLEEEIEKLKQQFPFNIQDKINNEEWVVQQQELLKNEIEKLKQYEKELQTEYEKLMNIYG